MHGPGVGSGRDPSRLRPDKPPYLAPWGRLLAPLVIGAIASRASSPYPSVSSSSRSLASASSSHPRARQACAYSFSPSSMADAWPRRPSGQQGAGLVRYRVCSAHPCGTHGLTPRPVPLGRRRGRGARETRPPRARRSRERRSRRKGVCRRNHGVGHGGSCSRRTGRDR
jgi:hypothetical protein